MHWAAFDKSTLALLIGTSRIHVPSVGSNWLAGWRSASASASASNNIKIYYIFDLVFCIVVSKHLRSRFER